MKLKKIASLMLAGIMAVSMLAACGEGKGNGNSGSSSSQVPSNTYSDTVMTETSAATQSVAGAKNSNVLNAAVSEAAKIAENSTDMAGIVGATIQIGNGAGVSVRARVRDVFIANLNSGVTYGMIVREAAGGAPTNVTADDGVYAVLCAFDRTMTDAQIDTVVTGMIDTALAGAAKNDGATKISYAVSAAKEAIGSDANGVVLVGIMIERTSTDAK